MASPMNWPPALTATYCLALPGPKFANEFTPSRLSSLSASGPLRNRSVMWCDWSNSTHEVRQAFCSVRQLVNSGATGKACGRAVDWRSSSTGDPARVIAASRLSDPMSAATSHGRSRLRRSLMARDQPRRRVQYTGKARAAHRASSQS